MGFETLVTETSPAPQEAPREFVTPEAIHGFENAVQNFADPMNRLTHFLRDREEEGLSELMDEGDIGRIRGSIILLQEVKLNEAKDFEQVQAALVQINRSIESIGTLRSRNIHEDTESLRTIAYALGMVGDTAPDVALQLKTIGTPESLEAAKQVDRLIDLALEKRMLVLKRMELVEAYLR